MVSVVIPVFNTKKELLEECIESALHQTVPCEIILVDDGSTRQETKQVLDQIESMDQNRQIKVLRSRNRPGQSRLLGACASSNDYIVFLDHDDVLAPYACEIMEYYIETNKTDFVQFKGQYNKLDKKEYSIDEYRRTDGVERIDGTEEIAEALLDPKKEKIGWEMWSCVFKKSILLMTFDVDSTIYFAGDLVTKTEYLLECQSTLIVDIPVYYYNMQNSESMTKAGLRPESLSIVEANAKIYEKIEEKGYQDLLIISGKRVCENIIGAAGNAYRVKHTGKIWKYRKMLQEKYWPYVKFLARINVIKSILIRFFPLVYYLPH